MGRDSIAGESLRPVGFITSLAMSALPQQSNRAATAKYSRHRRSHFMRK